MPSLWRTTPIMIKGKTLNLINHVAVETAYSSDLHAMRPVKESTQESGLEPEEVLGQFLVW